MKILIIILLLFLSCDGDTKTKKNDFGSKSSKDSIFTYLQKLDQFGIKNAGSIGSKNTRLWIIEKVTSWGYTAEVEDFTITSNISGKNIIVNKAGTVDEDRHIMITGHYDSVSSGSGVNDNGSGVAIMLEILRVFRNTTFEQNLRFVFFDAEELNLFGSDVYADKIYTEGTQLDFLLNLDMVGGHINMNHTKIVCEEDQNGRYATDKLSKDLNKQLIQAFKDYSTLNPVIGPAYGTDYVPFEKKGYTIIGLYEYRGQEDNPNYHKSTDTYSNIHKSYSYQVYKGALGFLENKLNKLE